MRVDDIWAHILANNAPHMAALSTTDYPLITLLDRHRTRDPFAQMGGNVMVYLDDQAEEVDEVAPGFRIVTLAVNAYIFVRGAKEANLREIALRYGQGLDATMHDFADYFGLKGREYFEGMEGNPDIKGALLKMEYKYEENT